MEYESILINSSGNASFLRAFHLQSLYPEYTLFVGSLGYRFDDDSTFWEYGAMEIFKQLE